MDFGWTLFNRDGTIRDKYQREGVAPWGPEVDNHSLLYLNHVTVEPEYRGRGIAKKALTMMFELPEVKVSRDS